MKRDEALAPLSREHHHGLVVAQQLIRAGEDTVAEARDAFLAFWGSEGSRHFLIEEEVLLPGCAHRVPPDSEAVVRVLVDHVAIRRRAADLGEAQAPAVEDLHALGELLRGHIRHEERVLFPLIEGALSGPELAGLAVAVERAERAG